MTPLQANIIKYRELSDERKWLYWDTAEYKQLTTLMRRNRTEYKLLMARIKRDKMREGMRFRQEQDLIDSEWRKKKLRQRAEAELERETHKQQFALHRAEMHKQAVARRAAKRKRVTANDRMIESLKSLVGKKYTSLDELLAAIDQDIASIE